MYSNLKYLTIYVQQKESNQIRQYCGFFHIISKSRVLSKFHNKAIHYTKSKRQERFSFKDEALCCIDPFLAQGHINSMFKLAKLLHYRGCHITFVHTEFNSQHLLNSRGPNAHKDSPNFWCETTLDSLPPPMDLNSTQDIPLLHNSTTNNYLNPFHNLFDRLQDSASISLVPPVTYLVFDLVMTFIADK